MGEVESFRDDLGPHQFLIDPKRGWPKCDVCERVMDRDEPKCQPHVFAAICVPDGFFISFDSCRHGHRYCAWQRLHPLNEKYPV